MTSPQEEYSYGELLNYLAIAESALENFKESYPDLGIQIAQPEQDVATDLNQFKAIYDKRLFDMNAFLDPEELDGIAIGSYVGHADRAKRRKLMQRIKMEKKCFMSDLSNLIRLHETQMRVLYMELSRMSAKFTAGRIQELHRREEWVETQRHYFSLHHIKQCAQWSATKNIELTFVTEFNQLPESAGVYFLFLNGEIIYIGHSQNIRKRISGHEIVRKYHSGETGFDVECVYAELPIDEAQSVERKMIRLVKPRYNERGKI